MPHYAVAKGRKIGIYATWSECEAQVTGYSGAKFKKFNSLKYAQNFIRSANFENGVVQSSSYSRPAIQHGNIPSKSLKRSYTTSSRSRHYNSADESNSDESDSLEAIISKQMDDIEDRVNHSEKRINVIARNSARICNKLAILIEPPQPKKKRTSCNLEFTEDNEGYVQVYTDGACSSNGKRGACAGLGVYWGDYHPHNKSEPVSGRATNNCGEIQAATKAIKIAAENGIKKLAINTDSQFVINSVTKWMPGWKKRGWKLATGSAVKNEIDFKELDSVLSKVNVKWNYVKAHDGIHGNEMADRLAKAGAELYEG